MMKNKQDLSRRDFIRNSVMAGGTVLLSGVLPSHAQTPIFSAAENSDSPEAPLRIPKPVWEMNWSLPARHVMSATNPCCSSPTISVVMTGLI